METFRIIVGTIVAVILFIVSPQIEFHRRTFPAIIEIVFGFSLLILGVFLGRLVYVNSQDDVWWVAFLIGICYFSIHYLSACSSPKTIFGGLGMSLLSLTSKLFGCFACGYGIYFLLVMIL